MPSGKLQLYNKYQLNQAKDIISISSDSLKLAIVSAGSNAADLSLEYFNQITNEISAANGYTAGGEVIGNITITEAAGVTTINGEDFNILAAGGSITGRYGVLYSDTSAGKCLIGVVLLVEPAADLTALDTQFFVVQWPATGIFTLTPNNA